MMSIRFMSLLWVIAVASLLFDSRVAKAELAFYDNYEAGTIGANPTTPVIGNPYVQQGSGTDNMTVQANPLNNANNSSAQVMRVQRASGTPAGRVFIDLTPAQSAQIAAGDLLTVQFQHYQPEQATDSIALLVYENSLHDFTANAIDVEFLKQRAVKHYNDGPPEGFVDTGLVGTANWDDVKVVVDFITNKWSISLNGGAPVANLPFRNNGDYTTAASLLFGPSTSPVLGYMDNVRVYVGAIPEPTGFVSLITGAVMLPLTRRRSQSRG